jgi:hypothetical protein
MSRVIFYTFYFFLSSSVSDGSVNLCQWDCHHYKSITANGYRLDQTQNWGYFPLFPFLVSTLSRLGLNNPLLIGYFLNNLLLFISILILTKLFLSEKSQKERRFFYYLLSFSPATVYFSTFYTESLFLLMTSLVIWSLKHKQMHFFSLLLGLLPTTRGNGYFVVVSLLLSDSRVILRELSRKFVSYTCIGLAPICIVLIYGKLVLDEPYFLFKGSSIVAAIRNPNLEWIQTGITLYSLTNFVNLIVVVISIVACAIFLKEKMFFEFWLLFLTTVITTITIFNFRYILAIYPIYLLLARIAKLNRSLLSLCCLVYFIIFLILEYFWLLGMEFMV